ncbi:MAG: hypothetical protein PHX43_07655 [Alphaproteobacteria bacterium]|nr:hypothetical protein [Alphaproteobacteria bacterium]
MIKTLASIAQGISIICFLGTLFLILLENGVFQEGFFNGVFRKYSSQISLFGALFLAIATFLTSCVQDKAASMEETRIKKNIAVFNSNAGELESRRFPNRKEFAEMIKKGKPGTVEIFYSGFDPASQSFAITMQSLLRNAYWDVYDPQAIIGYNPAFHEVYKLKLSPFETYQGGGNSSGIFLISDESAAEALETLQNAIVATFHQAGGGPVDKEKAKQYGLKSGVVRLVLTPPEHDFYTPRSEDKISERDVR